MSKKEETANLPATLGEIVETYPALNPEVAEDIREALGGETLTARNLPRIVLPSGGGTTFEIPMGGGDVEAVKTIEGIILAYQVGRRFYASSDVSNTPPDCQSVDGVYGAGKPGGTCLSCPLSQWESGKDGRGQACKEYGNLAILLPGMGLAYTLQVPPTSLKPMSGYKVAVLAQTMGPLYGVITSLSLEKKTNPTGQPYASLIPKLVGRVPAEAKANIKAMAAMYKAVLASDGHHSAE